MRLRVAIVAAAVTTVLATVGTTVTTLAVADASVAGPRVGSVAAASWSASFDGFPGAAWKTAWGVVPGGQFGFDRMFAMTGGGLLVRYGAGSSAPSCTNCPSGGGGQFYTDLDTLGLSSMATSRTLSLRYQLKFPAGHDFGRGGKLPGLYGGSPGEASGGNHGDAWSTRFMWRNGNQGEVYFYSPDEDGYGRDLGLGAWRYPADDAYHTIEQFVDRSRQTITVWFDGVQVFTTAVTGIGAIDFSGIFFSTFYGGHSTEWGPAVASEVRFRNFSLSTAVQH
ncbi:hypothetical protein GCM10009557_28140 [Virgisporangium ochraceum]|uniref:Polysaccharide lyase 14 domain-containing protein n=1 Tax=Virgisporangium ochraceum TaxID=65505 RepID=A0A8J4EA34_9ACTN|nr:hypothetical protein [Virgisporangium ochraceum]GIJ66973.1 hypothetical protein Voc01_018900 [Virgisporangium ochraceum]